MKTPKLIALLAAAGLGLVAAPRSFADAVGTIEGTIVNEHGAVVPGHKVRVEIACGKVKKTATVDARGFFSVSGLPAGACTVTSKGAGFGTLTLSVTVNGGSISTVLVGMSPPRPARGGWEFEGGMLEAPVAAPAMEPAPPPDAKPRDQQRRAPLKRPGAPPPPPVAIVPNKPKPNQPRAEARLQAAKQEERAEMMKKERKDDRAGRARGRGFRGPAGGVAGEDANGMFAADLAFDRDDDIGRDPWDAGWAPVRVFPVPQYTKSYEGPRTDFRETIYWNPTVQTNADGVAEVTFAASDAVTAFRATAEGFSAGGAPGAGQLAIQSKLPLTLDARLPVEVTAGDTIRLPITIANETETPLDANLSAQFGAAFKLVSNPVSGAIRLRGGEKKTVLFPLEVVATDGDAKVSLALAGRGLEDKLEKTIRVVPRGFPFEASASGTASEAQPSRHTVDLAGALPGSIRARVTMYPSPLAAMTQGMEGMIREPGGCFEQTSSTNYPNIMILAYLGANEGADPGLVQKTQGVLDRGYKLLTGYETQQRGYEWFGKTPGHEALTAYGLMEFADMAKVYDVDMKMVERTADWLMSRRDGKGGFGRSATALDSFGRASEATTNAYIMWALAEAGRTRGLDKELAAQRDLGTASQDPYLVALATNTALLAAPRAPETAAMVKRLVAMQGKDGSFQGAKESITMSGGESLAIETTALAALALIKASPNHEYTTQVRASTDWLNAKRGGYGQWSNTQATILGLKALTAYAEHARVMSADGSATVLVNGQEAGTIAFDKGRREALVWEDVAASLRPGANTIEVRLAGGASLPYSIAIEYRSARPQSSPNAKVAVATQLLASKVAMGEGVTLRAKVENRTAAGVPMTLARVGIPGGLVFQTWQLKELRDKGLIDFYETRPREVILYWRALPPSAKKEVDLNLLAQVPGTYEAPASSAYLYYTAEDKAWTAPVQATIESK